MKPENCAAYEARIQSLEKSNRAKSMKILRRDREIERLVKKVAELTPVDNQPNRLTWTDYKKLIESRPAPIPSLTEDEITYYKPKTFWKRFLPW